MLKHLENQQLERYENASISFTKLEESMKIQPLFTTMLKTTACDGLYSANAKPDKSLQLNLPVQIEVTYSSNQIIVTLSKQSKWVSDNDANLLLDIYQEIIHRLMESARKNIQNIQFVCKLPQRHCEQILTFGKGPVIQVEHTLTFDAFIKNAQLDPDNVALIQ